MEKPDFNPSTATVYELVQEVLRLRADIAIMAANVVQQAVERDWCGEYEQWARITNRQMSRPHCIDRSDLESEDYVDTPAPLPVYDEQPVYVEPATGLPALAGCQCNLCREARGEVRDPALDESGRFGV